MNRSANYGPWATTLDTEPSSRLDTFWQRRMAMLPELNRMSSRVRPRTRTLLAALAMAALAAPLVYLSRPTVVGADDTKPPAAGAKSAHAPVPSVEFLPPLSDNEKKLMDALDSPTTLEFTEAPLTVVIDYLSDLHAIPIIADNRAILDESINIEQPVTLNVKGISLRNALTILLEGVADPPLTFVVENDVLKFTTPDAASTKHVTRTYPVGDLVQDGVTSALIAAITNTVKPVSWTEAGGEGSVESVGNSLVISQTRAVHEEVLEVLRSLRAAKTGGDGQ